MAGNGVLGKSGAGTLALTGANTNFTGGVSVTGGLVSFAASNNLGSGTITLNGGGLQWATGTTTDISSRLAALGAGGGTLDTNGNTVSLATGLSGGALTKAGTGTLTFTAANSYTGATTISAGTLALSGGGSITSSSVTVASGAIFDTSAIVGGSAIQALAGSGTVQLGNGLNIINAASEFSGSIQGSGPLGILSGTQTLSGVNTYTGISLIDPGATLALKGAGSIEDSAPVNFNGLGGPVPGMFDISQTNSGATVSGLFDVGLGLGVGAVALGGKTLTITFGAQFEGVIQDGGIGGGVGGSLVISAPGGATLRGINTYTGSTTIVANGLLALSGTGSIASSSGLSLSGAGATFDIAAAAGNVTIKDLSGVAGSTIQLGSNSLTVGTANSTTFAGVIDDSSAPGGSLVKQGSGTLTLTGTNTYTGGTTISGGLINFAALANFGTGMVTLNGGGLQWAAGTTTDISSRLVLGASGATLDTNGSNITFANGLTGAGGITKQGNGILNLAGTNTYTGPTAVNGGTLAVNGSITSNVAVGSGGTLGGNGTIFGTVSNAGTLAPGNSIGTLNVSGSFVQSAGSVYQVEVNAAGQGDRINVTGAPGTATINGTVQVLAQPGSYGASTTYTILNATGGVAGTYTSVTSNFAFLTPSLSTTPTTCS